MWLLGWILGSILVGDQSALRADHFRLFPIPRLRLATGLLGTAFVSIGTAVTLLAFVCLVTFAIQLGVGPTLVAVPAMALQLLFFLGLLPPLPALAVVLSGTLLKNELLCWTGSLVGLVTGIGVAWWFGHLAAQRLEKRGPELLSLMRHGKSPEVRATTPGKAVGRPTFLNTMPQWKQFVCLMLCPALGSLVFFAQGLAPLIIRLSGSHTRVWFLALYLPGAWQWPVIIFMLLLGLAIFGTMILLSLTHKKVWQRLQTKKGSSPL